MIEICGRLDKSNTQHSSILNTVVSTIFVLYSKNFFSLPFAYI